MRIYLGWGYFSGLSSGVLSIFRYPRFSHRPLQILCLGQFPYHFWQNREGLDILNSHIPDHYPRQYQFLISYPRQYSSKRSFSDSSFHWFSSFFFPLFARFHFSTCFMEFLLFISPCPMIRTTGFLAAVVYLQLWIVLLMPSSLRRWVLLYLLSHFYCSYAVHFFGYFY